MIRSQFIVVLFLISMICTISCSGVDKSDQPILSTDLDKEFTDTENRFSIRPPLDWKIKTHDDDWSFTPDVAELETRNAKAKIVIQYIKLDTMMNPGEFKDFIIYQLKQTEHVDEYKVIEYGGTPSDAYCSILVKYDSSVGRSTHYFRNILSGSGYYRVSGSALSKYWESASPLLKASIATFELK